MNFNEMQKLKEQGKITVLNPKRVISQRYISQMLQILGDNAMTAKEIGAALGLKKTPSKIRYYERIGYLKAITIEGKLNIHYIKGEKAIATQLKKDGELV